LERIRLERLTKVYDRHPVVADFSLSVAAGEFCVILGPSGSGKTTLLNMIAGFTAPTSGEIYVDGDPTTGLAPHQRDLGMMFQGYALFPHLTVYENVAFPLRARGAPDHAVHDRVERALAIVELSGFERRSPHELSGGQQQRTALARALVFGPRLLLMDEPLAALDRRLRERLQSEIKAIQRKLAITVLYITHDQQEAMTLADLLVVMNRGRTEQAGPPLDVYHHPRTRFVCEFLGDTNILDATVEAVAADVVSCRTAGGDSILIRPGAPVTLGQPITLAIRPEHLIFATSDAVGPNRIAGRIADVVDWGASRRYSFESRGAERSLQVTEPGRPNATGRGRGDHAILVFGIDDAVVLAASP
jgi:putative spermidine/putrescine transport system ATP-binding protein